MLRHILPNAFAPFIVVLTIALGTFIATEATLSFLGVGLRPPAISWGIDIADAQAGCARRRMPLVFPSVSCADRARLHHARRRDPRRLRPEAAVTYDRLSGDPPPRRSHLLEVRDLLVEFHTRTASRRVDQRRLVPPRRRARRWRCSASPAPASRSPRRPIMGILDMPPAVISGGEILYSGADLLTMPEEQRRQVRGTGDRDDLPGRAVGAQPGLPGRLADRRERCATARACPSADARRARRRADGPGADPGRRRSASTTTRTSSPAACASA